MDVNSVNSLDRRGAIRVGLSRMWPLLLLVLAIPVHAQQKPAPSSDPLVRMNESVDALTRKVWPSVVQILVSGYGAQEGSRADTRTGVVGPQSSTGSGFDGEVASCVASVVKLIKFPRPTNGGIVQVNYPFTFHAAGR